MTGVGSTNSKGAVIDAAKKLIQFEKLEDSDFKIVADRLREMANIPCYIVQEAYNELNSDKYDKMLLDMTVYIIKNYNTYFNNHLDIITTVHRVTGISLDIVKQAYKIVRGE